LFSEIREKRGLCYSVSAGYSSLPQIGTVLCYAGTSNERAQETLDAFLHELRRLSQGATADELSRAKIGLKAGTVMSGESSSARAGAIARDWFMRGRIRTLDEILAAIDAVTLEQLNEYLAGRPVENVTTVLIGPKKLDVPR
jgi:predicted Zn-dependent peptidase